MSPHVPDNPVYCILCCKSKRLSERVTVREKVRDRQRGIQHRGTELEEISILVTVNLMRLESGQPELAADGRLQQQAHSATHLCLVLTQAQTPGPEPPCRVLATWTWEES